MAIQNRLCTSVPAQNLFANNSSCAKSNSFLYIIMPINLRALNGNKQAARNRLPRIKNHTTHPTTDHLAGNGKRLNSVDQLGELHS